VRIAAPLDSHRETDALIDAGADEVYCGVHDRRWKRAGRFSNARHTFYGNLDSHQELARVIAAAHARRVPVFLCLNDHYPQDVMPLVEDDLRRALDAGADGLILAEPALVRLASRVDPGCKLVLSSLAPCFNSEAVRFFHDLGVRRVVPPLAQLSPAELRALIHAGGALGMEFEVFVTDTTCKNVNGFCVYHGRGIESFFAPSQAERYRGGLALARALSRRLPARARDGTGKLLSALGLGAARACREPYRITTYAGEVGAVERGGPAEGAPEGEFAAQYRGLETLAALAREPRVVGKIPGRGALTWHKLRQVRQVRAALDRLAAGAAARGPAGTDRAPAPRG
jgi:hypothetical protein